MGRHGVSRGNISEVGNLYLTRPECSSCVLLACLRVYMLRLSLQPWRITTKFFTLVTAFVAA
eukprot:2459091-Amphidinium_carterae.1